MSEARPSLNLLSLPEDALIEIGKCLLGPKLVPNDRRDDIQNFTRVSRRLHSIFRDPLNVCRLLSSPYYVRGSRIWNANLLVRLAEHPRWIADRKFIDFLLSYIQRKDADFRDTYPRNRLATPYSLNFLIERLSPFVQWGYDQNWIVAKCHAIGGLVARFWFPELEHLGVLMLEQRTVLEMRRIGTPIVHAYATADPMELWPIYSKRPCHPLDIVDLIQLTSYDDGFLIESIISDMRPYVERCGCDATSLRRAVEYRYFVGESMPRLRFALEALFPDLKERFDELKRICA